MDPATGEASEIVVVPAAQGESWKDGYSCYGLGEADEYAASSEPDQPILVVMAHDGDNAFGGGYSYYMECVPQMLGIADSKGYTPTTIAGYLADHPVPGGDIVHVEDGAWVNADGDFGAPTFWNWSWPLVDSSGDVDIANGWAEDQRNFAVLMAATNWVLTAEDALGPASTAGVLHPDHQEGDGATDLERAWHFLLGGLDSGYMYYGKVLDMELKPVIASNEAVKWAKEAFGGDLAPGQDTTPPTLFATQRYPDNPGGLSFGPLYHYKMTELGPETLFWTFAYDVSDIASVSLKYRLDDDGANPPGDDANETYAGGPGVGAWQALAMTRRVMPKGNVTGDPEIDTSILPDLIADAWYVSLDGVSEALVDYYIEAEDSLGNVARSPIGHVWIGDAAGQVSGKTEPAQPDCDDEVIFRGDRAGWLHWGIDGWQLPPELMWPEGTAPFGDGKSVETPLSACDEAFCAVLGPFGDTVAQVDFVFHYEDGSWDNNGGSDYRVTISPCHAGGDPGPETTADAGPEPIGEPGPEPTAEPTSDPASEPVVEGAADLAPDAAVVEAAPDAAVVEAAPDAEPDPGVEPDAEQPSGHGKSSGGCTGAPPSAPLWLLCLLPLVTRGRRRGDGADPRLEG